MVINPEIVVITSQYTPEQIWEGDNTTLDAIRRRVALINMNVCEANIPDGAGAVSTVLPYSPVGNGNVGKESFCVESSEYSNGYRTHITYEKN